jgi:hypothetical protein
MLNYPCGAMGDPNAPYNQAESESITITASLTIEKGRKLTDEEIVEELISELISFKNGRRINIQVSKCKADVSIEETE